MKNRHVGKDFHIGKNSVITCETFEVGDFCHIGDNVRITCKNFKAGDYLFIKDNAEIGHGGQFNYTSELTMGNGVFIGERATLNTARPIVIGDEVGIGDDAKIWTHGSYLSILDGFPSKFKGVTIGSNVWIQAMSHIMPGVKISDNTVILCGSIVAKSFPEGSLIGGNPAKVLKENAYPVDVPLQDKIDMIKTLTRNWLYTLDDKKTEVIFDSFKIKELENTIVVSFICNKLPSVDVELDLNSRKLFKYQDQEDLMEDFRDFLRRHGIRYMTDKPFKSIKTKWA